ncbi:MAG: DMT family transporter [Chloroflexota bacterium]|nr:DMT family transporter [Chloroflexota bacterium]
MRRSLVSSRGERIRADLILLAVAVVWGSAFVAQRTGMGRVGPFTFNAVRFALGSLVLLPVYAIETRFFPKNLVSGDLRGGILLGLLLFGGASLQQIGLIYTTAGQAGFVTGLYVVIVPLLLALVWRERVGWGGWLGTGLAVGGMFLLSVQAEFRLSPGDGWVLGGAFLWALHVIAIGRIVPGRDPLRLALVQYFVCALFSLLVALALERETWDGVLLAGPAILYTGILSTGLGYTGQVVAQRRTTPARAAIILSMEAVFAVLFGWLLLGERLAARQFLGCGLMLVGMVVAQLGTLVNEAISPDNRSFPHTLP